jgi:metal-sulfur cluster biosynthetic enzyme
LRIYLGGYFDHALIACPLGEQLVDDAEARLRALSGLRDVRVELVWDPPGSPERMSEAAKRALGWQL